MARFKRGKVCRQVAAGEGVYRPSSYTEHLVISITTATESSMGGACIPTFTLTVEAHINVSVIIVLHLPRQQSMFTSTVGHCVRVPSLGLQAYLPPAQHRAV